MPFPRTLSVHIVGVVSICLWSFACSDSGSAPASAPVVGRVVSDGGSPTVEPPATSDSPPQSQLLPRTADGGTVAPAVSTDAPVPLSSPSGEASASRAAVEANVPRTRAMTVPAGTTLTVRVSSDISSERSRVEDPVRGVVTKAVVKQGVTVVPEGAQLRGSVLAATRSGRVKGRASIAFRFDSLTAHGSRYDVRTERIARVAPATKGEDAKKIGIGAGAGAVLGAIAGGKKGTAIGSAVGAGGGTGVVLATKGREVRVPAGSVVTAKLLSAVTVQVPERE